MIKLKPINLCVDDMLTRLEEFEGLLALVQQERCTSIGLTGSLSQCADYKVKLKQYCTRIDSLEKLIEHIKNNISVLENKMDLAEKRVGIPESSSNLKTLLSPFRVSNVILAELLFRYIFYRKLLRVMPIRTRKLRKRLCFQPISILIKWNKFDM